MLWREDIFSLFFYLLDKREHVKGWNKLQLWYQAASVKTSVWLRSKPPSSLTEDLLIMYPSASWCQMPDIVRLLGLHSKTKTGAEAPTHAEVPNLSGAQKFLWLHARSHLSISNMQRVLESTQRACASVKAVQAAKFVISWQKIIHLHQNSVGDGQLQATWGRFVSFCCSCLWEHTENAKDDKK